MDYKEMLIQTEEKIEMYLNDILTNNFHRSVKAEEYLMALCKARDYLKDKVKEESFKELCKINAEITSNEIWEFGGEMFKKAIKEVKNEG